MGEIFAILSMTLFSSANVTINRGSAGRSRGRGAFLSIIITLVLSALLWLGSGVATGFSRIDPVATGWFALAGILTVLIGRVFLYASIQHLGAVRGSAVKRLNPFFSVLLGVLILGDTLRGGMAVGLVLIMLSFAMLVHQSLRASAGSAAQAGQSAFGRIASLGYVYGPVSALAYASGYVARKFGLLSMPDAAFGTMVGALTGGIFFIVLARFVGSYREDLEATFSDFNPWLLAAGVFGSAGQICYFVALKYITVSKIALITSIEVFLTMFLSWLVFRGELKIGRELTVAALLGVLGTVFVIVY